jgi:putative flippase GtrA
MKIDKKSLKELLLFFIVGGLATVVDWIVFYLFNKQVGLHYIISVILSYSFGGATSYTLNKIFTFKDKSKDFALQISLFTLIMTGAYGLNILFMYLQIEVLFKKLINLNNFTLSAEMIARVITTGLVFIYNFMMHKFITFNKNMRKRIKDKFTPDSDE